MSDDSDALRSNILQYPTGKVSGPIGGGPLTPGGGGYDGVEARLAKLEAGQEYIDRRLASIETKIDAQNATSGRIEVALARLDEKAAGKGMVVTVVLAALGVLAGLSVFEPQIRALTGLN